jgi:hypothetical protein
VLDPSHSFPFGLRRRPLENSYCEVCYFGGPANSESPVALRPSLARGMPFSFALRDACRFPLTCQRRPPNSVPCNHVATDVQSRLGARALTMSRVPSLECVPSHADTRAFPVNDDVSLFCQTGSTRRAGTTRTKQINTVENWAPRDAIRSTSTTSMEHHFGEVTEQIRQYNGDIADVELRQMN